MASATLDFEDASIVRVALLDEVREAAVAGVRLMDLWPLDAVKLGHDAQYTENRQVRVTRAIAGLITGQEVTMPDAEFVYEGADEIPGRPQEIVEALLAANEACDTVAGYSATGDTTLVMRAAGALKVAWDEDTVHAVAEALAYIEEGIGASVPGSASGSGDVPGAAASDGDGDGTRPLDAGMRTVDGGVDVEAVAQRFATVATACNGVMGVIENGIPAADRGDDTAAGLRRAHMVLPVMLYAAELCERLAIPPVYWGRREFLDMLAVHEKVVSLGGHGAEEFARCIAPLAGAEWDRHREDLLWDPEEAKKRAKEDDARRNREALAAKFAHVPEGSGTESGGDMPHR
ncbi:hypothetical protein [Bifidobacterium mongoliense]|uniref:hypothetical protein n=1 Tax=Bifidobacterium mongoliense TaxID=518643 RepID=UPI0026479F46|nr:hypothetical protein [Bifidobacterium mongoliense]MDN5633174.1 hypothetical protein [Bifidobacterium mongoliense]